MDYSFLKNKTVLISGATGMIGSQIIRKLLNLNDIEDTNVQIIALFRNNEKRQKVFRDILERKDIVWLKCDINKPIFYKDCVDYIIHTAGITGGSKQHIDFPLRTIFTAINGTVNTLELAKEKSVQGFVFLSSLEVYGKTDFDIPSIKETDGGYIDSMAIRSSYAESKRMCETICVSYAKQYGIPAKVVRLTATYGAGAYYEDKRVLCEFARNVIEKSDIVLRSTGDTVRNYCDVTDAINAILCVLGYGTTGEAYNVANMDTEISIKDLAERFIQLYPESGISIKFDIPEDITELGYNKTVKIRLDSSKLQTLGWQAKVDIDQMIRNLVNAMRLSKDNL